MTPNQTIKIIALVMITIFFFSSCRIQNDKLADNSEIPIVKHDVSYIPFNAQSDDASYTICDSTNIGSGRNRYRYEGGNEALRNELMSSFNGEKRITSFTGFIVVRFLVNCKGQRGRFRARAMNLDFSPSSISREYLSSVVDIVKACENWINPGVQAENPEYSKFINFKFENGKLHHILF